ncbi:Maf family protein [Anaerotignum faecicola]|uniref:Maf family protein n=2 Tax=Clostridia TaxID=186801 RepID=UPI001C0293E7|nr:septum formation inhibitor Maf [Clostridium sp. MCC345]
MMELILASASPRRKELLEKIGLPFTVQPAKGEERITQKSPAAVVMELSRQKAEEIAAAQTEDCIIIGADTVVARGDKIMGKPKDAADAKQMLRSIADDCHQVYTGVTLIRTGAHPQSVTFQEKTDVFLYPISDAELDAYIASGDPMDKAGAYGIQGDFAIYVKRIAGDYYNVVGLPIGRVYQELKRMLFVKK